jgi:hypothetical protein
MADTRLRMLLACFGCINPQTETTSSYSNEKAALLSAYQPRPVLQVADDVVATLLATTLTGPALHMQLDGLVGTCGWTENLAKWILEKLSLALQQAHDRLGPAVRDAYHRAWEVAKNIEGFVIEHPVFCTIIALGVLVSDCSFHRRERDVC